ncbi:MAG: AAA family ATPase [Owenweeksia sp.]|nr:AAA family ATPase [Owenweeksia sp.]
MKRVIITGGPGTGKTSVLSILSQLGYPTHEEISRKVIREELQKTVRSYPGGIHRGSVNEYLRPR